MPSGTTQGVYDETASEGAIIDVYDNYIDIRGMDLKNEKYLPIAQYRLDTTLINIPAKEVEVINYTITNTLSNTTNNNSATSITSGSSYSGTVSAKSGYTLSSVKVTMGGTDVTSSVYSNGVITISSVTGNIVITASASAITYTVTNTLSNATNSNSATNIASGSSYSSTISASSGYIISTIKVTMGGTDITSTSVSGNNISISSVTGNIVITVTTTNGYTITNNLTNATNSNSATSITSGSTYVATISGSSGYSSIECTVTMGGADITSTAYKNGTINISSITGNIVVTAKGFNEAILTTLENAITNYYNSKTENCSYTNTGNSYTITCTSANSSLRCVYVPISVAQREDIYAKWDSIEISGGMFSGLASTGLYEAFRNLIKKEV